MGSIPQLSVIKGSTRIYSPKKINKQFEDIAEDELFSNKLALIFNDKQHTYSELHSVTNKIARKISQIIKSKNLPKNKDGDYLIAVNMHPSDNLIITLLSIWKAGAAYLPLDHAFPGPRIEHIIREAKPALIIYDQDNSSYLTCPKISFSSIFEQSFSFCNTNLDEQERVLPDKHDLAIVLYTSGSTGVPKGVRLPHKIIQNRLNWQFKTFPYSQTEEVCVFKTALTFVDSVSEIWGPLVNGRTILVVSKDFTKDPQRLIELLNNNKVERLVLVPSLLRSLLMYLQMQDSKTSLQSLKLWVCSGETLTTSLAEEFFKYFTSGAVLCNFYGSTEIMGDVTYHVIDSPAKLKHQDKVPIGLPIENTIIYLLDNQFRPVKAGEAGELFVAGLNVAAGYVNGRDPDKFMDNSLTIDPNYSKLYRTGDFARLEKGTIVYEGRTDSQVKIRGHRVDLSEVEKAVNSLEGVEKAVVLCYKPGEINQALLAFATTTSVTNEHVLEGQLKDKLAPYMVPQVILLETIPLLVNGKIDRQALLKSYENTNNNDDSSLHIDIDYSGVQIEKMTAAKVLFETVALVLNRSARSAISASANFYELGGNSLNSIFTITRLNEQGYYINITDFISAMDLGEILERMTSKHKIVKQPPAFSHELLQDHNKEVVLNMITTSFYQKADLEQWIVSEISESDYRELVNALWKPLLEKNLSFIARNDFGKIVGVALNMDAHDEPEVEIRSKLTIIFEFLESIEGPVRDNQLPQGKGKVLHSFMMATHSSLTAKENVSVMQFMEDEVLKLAKKRGFQGIFTTNTSPLTQQLGTDVYNYETKLDYQVNQFVASDNTKPFGLAPDTQRAIVQWKPI